MNRANERKSNLGTSLAAPLEERGDRTEQRKVLVLEQRQRWQPQRSHSFGAATPEAAAAAAKVDNSWVSYDDDEVVRYVVGEREESRRMSFGELDGWMVGDDNFILLYCAHQQCSWLLLLLLFLRGALARHPESQEQDYVLYESTFGKATFKWKLSALNRTIHADSCDKCFYLQAAAEAAATKSSYLLILDTKLLSPLQRETRSVL